MEAVIAAMVQHLVESLPRRVEAVIAAKGGNQLHINAHDFGMRCSTSRCPHTVSSVVECFVLSLRRSGQMEQAGDLSKRQPCLSQTTWSGLMEQAGDLSKRQPCLSQTTWSGQMEQAG